MKRMLMTGAALLLLSLLLITFFLGSSPGLRLLISSASSLSGGMVHIEKSGGRLLGSFNFNGIAVAVPGAGITIAELQWEWQPAELFSGHLHIADISARDITITLHSTQEEKEESVTSEPVVLPALSIPLSVLINRVRLEAVVLEDEQGDELFRLDELSGSLSGSGDHLKIDTLMARNADYELTVRAEVQTVADWPVELSGTWRAGVPGCNELQGEVAITGTAGAPELTLTTLQPEQLTVKGRFRELLENPSAELELQGKDIKLTTVCSDWPSATADLGFTVKGDLAQYQGNLQSSLTPEADAPYQAVLDFTGDETGLNIDLAEFETRGNRAELTGRLDWQEQLSWETSLVMHAFDLSVYEDVPRLLIDADIHSTGRITDDGVHYLVESRAIKAVLEDPSISVSGALQLEGGAEQMHITESRFDFEDGFLGITGSLDWAAGLAWDGRLRAEAFDPSIFSPLPEGSIDAEISSNGEVFGDSISLETVIDAMSGTFAGYDLLGRGRLGYRDGQLTAHELSIKNGNNIVQVEGTVDDSYGLDFTIAAPDLHLFLPRLQGDVQLNGQLRGDPEQPLLTLTGSGQSLAYEDYRLGSLGVEVNVGLFESGSINADLTCDNLVAAGLQVEQAQAGITGSIESHDIVVAGKTSNENLRLKAAGRFVTEEGTWHGTLTDGDFEHNLYGKWQQREQALVSVSAERISIDSLCLFSGRLPGTGLCAAGSWESAGEWSVEASELQLELAELNRWKLLSPPLQGTVTGAFTAQGSHLLINAASGSIDLPEFSLDADTAGLYKDLRWLDTGIKLSLEDSRLLTTLDSRFMDGSTLNTELHINGFGDLAEPLDALALQGQIKLDLKDLSPLIVLTGDYLVPSGHLTADVSLGGDMKTPSIDGDIALRDGELRFPSLGMSLSDVTGDLAGKGDRLTLNLEAVSGEGRASGSGELDFSGASWKGQFTVQGKDVQLVDQNDLNIVADPDVKLVTGPDGGRLTGRVVIPKALVSPEEMTSSDSASDDVILVNEATEGSSWPFSYQIRLELGDDVRVQGYGLNSRLLGNLDISQAPEGPLVGRGELRTDEGLFSIYERSIAISRGRIIFDGGPIGNPGLDISARKKVKTDRYTIKDVVVGVNISGTVRDYKVELFSIPSMEDSEILTFILLDDSSESSEKKSKNLLSSALSALGDDGTLGDAAGMIPIDTVQIDSGSTDDDPSVAVGKNLTEDLAVSYDYSPIKNVGYFKIRYYFGRGFSVETRSSVESNGLELIYSFER